MNLMEQFSDPELIHSLSLQEKLAGSGVTAAMGMGVTFSVLVFLWICISIMARLMARKNHVGSNAFSPEPDLTAAAGTIAAAATAPMTSAFPVSQAAPGFTAAPVTLSTSTAPTDMCHMAVIAGAVAAYEGADANLIVRGIKRGRARHIWSAPITERKVSK